MNKTQKIAPLHLTVPITRIDEETREVEGYAFVNEVVPGEGGIRLKRTAMEAATSDYMKWGAIREMHQPSAVGTAVEAKWDEKGLVVRAKIVDDQAWEKCREGVYKAYSVGVQPRVMRGNDVEACTHVETSLVDRPKDEDAVLFRLEGSEAQDCEMIEEAPAPVVRSSFAEEMGEREPNILTAVAFDTLSYCLWEISQRGEGDKAEMARQAIMEFADYVCPIVARGAMPEITRLGSATLEQGDMLTRAEFDQAISAKDSELATARQELAAAIERAKTLESAPEPMKAVRFTGVPLERTFLANGEGADQPSIEDEILELSRQAETASDQERHTIATKIMALQSRATT